MPVSKRLRIVGLARTSDPETSHEAAASLPDLRASQQAVLTVIKQIGACTDEWLVYCYPATAQARELPRQSPSGIRTRRKELVEQGLVEWTGEKRPIASGRNARVWVAK